ncbi:unnamed protein product [Owenia fusiformis]|uniref:Uncharacterized protein n=1 Tax=Owenia fusiformis TaxID=6347 RepID=A0A8J1TZJ1_OWEFU|nr:unnamed protein product [Owenia fusiformis]
MCVCSVINVPTVGDPHVSVQLNDGLKTHFCFNVIGKSGEIFQLVRERNIEIRIRIVGHGGKQAAKLVDLIAIRTNEAQVTVDSKGITDGKTKYKWGSESVGEFGDANVMIRRNYAEIFVDKTVTEIKHQGDHLKFSVHQHGGFGPNVHGILGDVVNQGQFKKGKDAKHGHIKLFGSTFSVAEKVKDISVGKCWFLTDGYNALNRKLRSYVKKTLFGSN